LTWHKVHSMIQCRSGNIEPTYFISIPALVLQ
jgi:hypothetical protein